MTEKQTILHAHKAISKDGESFFRDFYQSPKVVSLCGSGPIHRVLVRSLKADEVSRYWGWWTNAFGKPRFDHVFPSRSQVEMCFTYGYQVAEQNGRGLLMNVFVEDLGVAKQEGEV